MTPSRIFFDTEFEGLRDDAALISIGLINAAGSREFYAECADTYAVERCSAFCQQVVLPLLEGGAVAMPLADVRRTLYAWLQAEGDCVLVCDSPRDIVQLRALFPEGLPPACRYEVLGFFANWRRRILNAGSRLHRRRGLRAHHALDDARVNRLILG